ncbi:uncharacterized protein TM35_000122070 [Trypanosoma theileri]|uniref:Uncharacterized protein n=1 Tax=Trypanosoma theileri TaxID=67003 RepID=A0A1X0NXM4_9TRYP|nr:uncharacterized protein TM35_000122070 [Trypanosoma theileri]ORC89432.1 hypothetical protein TM35_000122070 [Trypanosoma theileri]
MFRRISSTSCAFNAPFLVNARRFLIPEDPLEREREKELREKVLQRYRGMKIPEMVNFRYGHFASEEGATASAASQAYYAANGGLPIGGAGSTGRQGVDWLMLFTGCALVYVTSKFMLRRFSGGDMDDVSIPLWTASLDVQAKYLLFSIQFDVTAREEIRKSYHNVRQANPFTDFFQWLRFRHPEFGQGIVYSYDDAVETLTTILSSGNSQTLMILARGVQNALRKKDGNPAQRIDEFLISLGALARVKRMETNTLVPGYVQPTLLPPQPTVVYGTEPTTIQNALDATPSERHSSVPFQ